MPNRLRYLTTAIALLALSGLGSSPAAVAQRPTGARAATHPPAVAPVRTPCLRPTATAPATATPVPPTPSAPSPTVVPPRTPLPTFAPPPPTATPLGSWGPGSSATPAASPVRLLCVAPVGGYPYAVAVDQVTARAFVLTMAALDSAPNSQGSVSVLDAVTGDVVGTTPVGLNPQIITVDERAGRVFVLNAGRRDTLNDSESGSVSVLDAATGALITTVSLSGSPVLVALAVQAGRVFVTTRATHRSNGSLNVLDARTGALLHTSDRDAGWIVAVDEHAGRVFVSTTNSLRVLDAATGALVRTIPLRAQNYLVAVNPAARRLFVYTPEPGRMRVLDATTGTLLRTTRLVAGFDGALALDVATNRVFAIGTSPSSFYDSVKINVLDATTGRLLRVTDALPNALPRGGPLNGGFSLTVPAEARRHWASAAVQRSTVQVTTSLGQPSLTLAGRGIDIMDGDPTVDERAGRVIVRAQQGVSVLDAATGGLIRSVHLGEYPGHSLADLASKRIFIPNSKRNVIHVLDLTTGALVGTVGVGVAPHGMAVDERTGRLFVSVTAEKVVKVLDTGRHKP